MNNIVAIRQLKNSLSRYLELVKSGETIVITDRSRPVAQIVPISQEAQLDSEWQGLIAAGTLRVPLESLADNYFTDLLDNNGGPEPLPDGATVRAVTSEREESAW